MTQLNTVMALSDELGVTSLEGQWKEEVLTT